MTREPESCDWCPKPATKRIEDVRGYETAVACDGCVKYGIRYVLPIDDPRCGDRHDGDDGEAGDHEPRGDSPDSPPAGGPGVPGRDPKPIAPGACSYDTGIDWPVRKYQAISISPLYVSLDGVHFHEVPDGAPISDFLAEISGK